MKVPWQVILAKPSERLVWKSLEAERRVEFEAKQRNEHAGETLCSRVTRHGGNAPIYTQDDSGIYCKLLHENQ